MRDINTLSLAGMRVMFLLVCLQLNGLLAQMVDFNETFAIGAGSTSFQQIEPFNHELLVLGQVGIDSNSLGGFCLIGIDSNAEVSSLWPFNDPLLVNDLIVDGNRNMLITSDDNIFISGIMLPEKKIFVTKIDSTGNELYFNEFETSFRTIYIHSIIELLDEYYIIGFFQTKDFDHDVFVMKVDSDGNMIWLREYGKHDTEDTARSALSEDDGITILVTQGYDDTPNVLNDTNWETLLVHIDTSGSIEWEKQSLPKEEGPTTGGFLKDESGYLYSTLNIYEIDQFSSDRGISITKRDNQFNLLWKRDYSEINGINRLKSLHRQNECQFLAAGQLYDDNIWAELLKVDAVSGDVIWEIRDTGIYNADYGPRNILNDIIQMRNGDIYAVGNSFNKKYNFNEGLLMRVTHDTLDSDCQTSRVIDLDSELADVLVYPNPNSGVVYISLPVHDHLEGSKLVLYDVLGTVLGGIQLNAGVNQVNFEYDLGVYNRFVYWIIFDSDDQHLSSGKLILID